MIGPTNSTPRGPHAPLERVFGAADALTQAWVEAGKPHDFRAFRLGYDAGKAAAQAAAKSAGPTELVTELQAAGRLLFMAHKQMSPQQRAMYQRNAHGAGLIREDDTRSQERAAVLAKFGAEA